MMMSELGCEYFLDRMQERKTFKVCRRVSLGAPCVRGRTHI